MSDYVVADVGEIAVNNVNCGGGAWAVSNKCVVPNGDVVAVDINGTVSTRICISVGLAKITVFDGDVMFWVAINISGDIYGSSGA